MSDIGQNLSNFASRLEAIAEKQRDVYGKGYSDAIGIGPPSGEIELPENGTFDVTTYATAKVNVTPVINLQEKTVTENGDVLPDSGYDGLSKVTVNVVADDGSSIAQFAEGTVTELNPTNLAGCTAIGDYAFNYNRAIKNVTLPNTVVSIGQRAFNNAFVESLYLPDSVTLIGEYAFSSAKLTNLRLPNNDSLVIGASAFYGNPNIENIEVPCGVLGGSAFSGCANVRSVTVGENVKSFSNGIFTSSTMLETIYYNAISPSFTGNVTNASMFRGCGTGHTNGITVHIGKKVKTIPRGVFTDSTSYKGTITSVIFPEDSECETLDTDAFRYNKDLKTINLPQSITTIYGFAFAQCGGLETITLPEGITKLDTAVFTTCTSLQNIKIPKAVSSIDSSAFSGCTALEYVDMLDYESDGVFPTLANINAFSNCGKNTTKGTFEIRVPAGRKTELIDMDYWSTYADNIVEVDLDAPEVETFIFYINSEPYEAMPGMTWEEWVTTSYSEGKFTIINDYIRTADDTRYYVLDSNNEAVRPTYPIGEGLGYEILRMEE